MKLVVITGCLGLIGNYVTKQCLKKGWKVYGIDKMTYAANKWALEEFLQNDNFTFVKEDICNLKSLPAALISLASNQV
jgi:dTDP-glucose 4,6-dehydratase